MSHTLFWPFRTMILAIPPALSTICGPVPANSPSVVPAPQEDERARHEAERSLAELHGNASGTLLIGDSIFALWHSAAEDLERPISNFGVSGDRTENVLDRINRARMAPDAFHRVVLLIGTNNLHRDDAYAIFGGIAAIVEQLHQRLPEAAVHVVSILPRGQRLAENRHQIETVNRALIEGEAALRITYIDAFTPFVQGCAGQENCSLFVDGLHPSPAGYDVLGRSIRAALGAP
jgi:lysophospholipase L1-like esterase